MNHDGRLVSSSQKRQIYKALGEFILKIQAAGFNTLFSVSPDLLASLRNYWLSLCTLLHYSYNDQRPLCSTSAQPNPVNFRDVRDSYGIWLATTHSLPLACWTQKNRVISLSVTIFLANSATISSASSPLDVKLPALHWTTKNLAKVMQLGQKTVNSPWNKNNLYSFQENSNSGIAIYGWGFSKATAEN